MRGDRRDPLANRGTCASRLQRAGSLRSRLCDDQRSLSSDGESPIGIAVHGDLLYVLNVESKPHHRDCIDRMDTNKVENLPILSRVVYHGEEKRIQPEGARVAD